MTRQTQPAGKLNAIPTGVWALGFVSMLMDISSEMIHALLPLYLVVALGTSALTVGIIEGIAEATALITKVFSGAVSDWLGKRRRQRTNGGECMRPNGRRVAASATSMPTMTSW
jgi:hypothetical protein